MDLTIHVPKCVLERQADEPTSLRDLVVDWPGEPLIGFVLPTPPELHRYEFLRSKVWAHFYGTALLSLLVETKLAALIRGESPPLHRSIVRGKIAVTHGTTIALTARTHDRKHTLVAPWDYGEDIEAPMRRLGELRMFFRDCPTAVGVAIARGVRFEDVCPPQVLLSIVAGLDRPEMSLGSAPGMAPIAVAVGREWTNVVMDHRLFDSPEEELIAEGLPRLLQEKIQAGGGAR